MKKQSILCSRKYKEKYLVVVTGISGSGKTTLSKQIKGKSMLLSMDDFKEEVYEEYGFIDEYERKILWNMAKCKFQSSIIRWLRWGKNVIVEYPFDVSWQEFFDKISKEYEYKLVIVNCNTREFDDVWVSRVDRDSDAFRRPLCLTASSYIRGKLYKNNNKICDEYKELKRKEYLEGKYTSLNGDYILSDEELRNVLK